MDQFARLLPYVWRHRSKVYLSVFFALVVAVLWAATLSMTFLVVKVLLQGQSLQSYLASEIQSAETEIIKREQEVRDLDQALTEFTFDESSINVAPGTPKSKKEVNLLRRLDQKRRQLSTASQRLVAAQWIQRHILGWIPEDQFNTYALILGVLVLATAIKGTAVFIQEMLVGSVVELSVLALRKDCFRHALELDYQTLALHGTADLMSRFTNDINIAADGLSLLGGRIVREPLKAAACILAAFYVNWQLTALSLVCVPLMAITFHRYGKLLKRASQHMMERMSRIYKSLEETFDGLKIVIAFNGARRHRLRFHRENKDYYQTAMKVVRIDALTSPTIELLLTMAVCFSLLPGAYLVLRHRDSIWGIKLAAEPMLIEDLSVLYVLLAGTLDPIRKLSAIYSKLKRSSAAIERVFEVLDWKPALQQASPSQLLPRHSQSISFKKVSFKYASAAATPERPDALTDVTLKVVAGEVVIVVGENGSGKSTLVNLLPRYYDPDRGTVHIDGIDIRHVRLRDLRNQIGVVTQETLLFDDTIYDNIRYGKPDATHAEVLAAADKAHVTQLFDQLPEGFDTRVGPRGNRLSGGQRQRIALARALLRDPTILILDEATSAVDAQSESLIHQCLGDFVKGRTVFLITHSVTSQILEFATRIVVMDQGQLLATGRHEELLHSCPAYQRLYRAQSFGRGGDSQGEFQLDASAADSEAESTGLTDPPHFIKFPPTCDEPVTKDTRRKTH
ncbi:MAG: ABC transporter ATP-binding protein [Planctomycetaceae bacterium]